MSELSCLYNSAFDGTNAERGGCVETSVHALGSVRLQRTPPAGSVQNNTLGGSGILREPLALTIFPVP